MDSAKVCLSEHMGRGAFFEGKDRPGGRSLQGAGKKLKERIKTYGI